jgi:GT2 family glycosyltransferase
VTDTHTGSGGFLPTWVGQVELAEPLTELIASAQGGPGRYTRARILVRLHGQPLGSVDVPTTGDRVSPDAILASVGENLAGPLAAHLARDGLVGAELSVEGLPSLPEPSCGELGPFGEREPFVSVVVPTRDRTRSLRKCLHALLSLDYPAYEVIVVDSSPVTNGTVELAFALGDQRVRYFVEPVVGTSRARNKAVSEARGDVVAFTDDDAIADPQWLRGLVRGFTRAPDVGSVTGLVPTAELESESQLFFDRRVSWGRSWEPRLYDLEANRVDDPLYPYIAGVFGTGANFAASRAALDRLGGFDEALGPGAPPRGGEDLDFFLRVILAGMRIAYEPAALAWHSHRRREDDLRGQLFGYGSGLTAYAFKQLLVPENARSVVTRIPAGLRRLVSTDAVSPSRNIPARLRAIELAGAFTGPAAYLLGRRRASRRRGPRGTVA